jgi:hypothetical protein
MIWRILLKHAIKRGCVVSSVVDPNPKESEYFGWIRIHKVVESGSNTDMDPDPQPCPQVYHKCKLLVDICLTYAFDVHTCLRYGRSYPNYSFWYSWYTKRFTKEKCSFCMTLKKFELKFILNVLKNLLNETSSRKYSTSK